MGPRRRTSMSALVCFALLGSSQFIVGCEESSVTTEYDLSGYVRTPAGDEGETDPVGNATVRFTSDTGLVSTTQTDERGRYEMQVASDIVFGQVRAEATGFAPAEATVYFDSPQRRLDLEIRPL